MCVNHFVLFEGRLRIKLLYAVKCSVYTNYINKILCDLTRAICFLPLVLRHENLTLQNTNHPFSIIFNNIMVLSKLAADVGSTFCSVRSSVLCRRLSLILASLYITLTPQRRLPQIIALLLLDGSRSGPPISRTTAPFRQAPRTDVPIMNNPYPYNDTPRTYSEPT